MLSDSQSGVWHWKYLLHQELFSAQPWSFKQPRYQLLSFTLKRGHCHSWIFFFKWLEKSPSLNTVRVKINFKRLPGSASVLHNSVKSVIESPGQRASLFLYFFFFIGLYNCAPLATGYIKIFSCSMTLTSHNEAVGQDSCLLPGTRQTTDPRGTSQDLMLFTITQSCHPQLFSLMKLHCAKSNLLLQSRTGAMVSFIRAVVFSRIAANSSSLFNLDFLQYNEIKAQVLTQHRSR